MRDFLYHSLWFALLPLTFASAHLGILLWIWIALLPPADLMYGSLGVVLPFNKLAAASVFLVMLTKPTEKRFYMDALMTIGAIYAVVVTLSYLLSPINNPPADLQYDKFWKELVLAVLITGLMFTRHRLQQIAIVLSVSFGFYVVKEGLIFLLTAGGHKVTGSGVVGDNNGMAMSILMIIPFMLYMANRSGEKLIRIGTYAVAVFAAVTVVATYSRGGFVGLLALGVMLLKGSRYKVRTIIAVAVLGVILYHLMPDDYLDRINTIKTAEEDNSFSIRLLAWKINFMIASDHPILGLGPYASVAIEPWFTYVTAASKWLFPSPLVLRTYVAHSIYFQVLGDTGFTGLFFFILMLLTALGMTIRTQRLARRDPSLDWAADLARASQISIVMYMVCGAALSNVYFEILYIVLALISRNHRTVAELTVRARLPVRPAMVRGAVPAFGRAI